MSVLILDKEYEEYIQQKEEIERLKKTIDTMIDNEEEYCLEINRLNNIKNELEKYLIEEVKQPIVDPAEKEYIEGIKSALYKLQELKGSE